MRAIILFSAVCVLGATGCSVETKPKGDAAMAFHTDLRGREYRADVAQSTQGFLWAQDIFSSYKTSGYTNTPSRISTLKSGPCRFARPSHNASVHHVHVQSGTQLTPIHQITNPQLSKTAKRYIDAYIRRSGKDMDKAGHFTAGGPVSLVNVAVTETTKPIYLVLTSQSNVIWNFQIAPGAKIENVAMISNDALGYANLPTSVKPQALFGATRSRCKVQAARRPMEHWSFVRNSKTSNSGAKLLKENHARADEFGNWFRRSFRISADQHLGDKTLSNVLIGPHPIGDETRLAFKSLEGSTVFISPKPHTFVANSSEFKDKSRALVIQTAQKAAGGNLAALVSRTGE